MVEGNRLSLQVNVFRYKENSNTYEFVFSLPVVRGEGDDLLTVINNDHISALHELLGDTKETILKEFEEATSDPENYVEIILPDRVRRITD